MTSILIKLWSKENCKAGILTKFTTIEKNNRIFSITSITPRKTIGSNVVVWLIYKTVIQIE